MGLLTLVLATLLLTATVEPCGALMFKAINNATSTPGGARFNEQIGLPYSRRLLASAATFIWKVFAQSSKQHKKVSLETLTITSMDGIAYTTDDSIYVSTNYIAQYDGDVKAEFTGIMYHESTHVWQWSGNGSTPGGLIEGVADFVRLKAGYAPSHWVKPGHGDRWDEGYDVTAHFLNYCNDVKDGFVAELNSKMKDSYSDHYFEDLLGKTVGQLWKEYKAHYNGTYN